MKIAAAPRIAEPRFRSPGLSDGRTLHRLAVAAGTLDVNSEYAYLLPGLHHADACVLAEVDGVAAGFISGYLIPEPPRHNAELLGIRLFIWQVGVHPDFRRQGLAGAMLVSLLSRAQNRRVRYVETTVSQSNEASLRTFQSFARAMDTEMTAIAGLGAQLFHSPHEAETVYRIGPFDPAQLTGKRKS